MHTLTVIESARFDSYSFHKEMKASSFFKECLRMLLEVFFKIKQYFLLKKLILILAY
jgi:hypothetical protein